MICLDTSLSPDLEQFHRLQAVMEEVVRRDVSPNDLIFLIQIESGFGSTKPFAMPAGTTLASRKPEAAQVLADAKAQVIAAINAMKQDSHTTDLESTLHVALDLLRQEPNATQRLLLIGTDYITDNGSVTSNPPTSPIRVTGIDTLLVAYPKPEYLHASRLLGNIETKWAAYLETAAPAP